MQEPQPAQAVYEMLLNAIKTSDSETVNNILDSLREASVFSQDQWSSLIGVAYKKVCESSLWDVYSQPKIIFCKVFSTLCSLVTPKKSLPLNNATMCLFESDLPLLLSCSSVDGFTPFYFFHVCENQNIRRDAIHWYECAHEMESHYKTTANEEKLRRIKAGTVTLVYALQYEFQRRPQDFDFIQQVIGLCGLRCPDILNLVKNNIHAVMEAKHIPLLKCLVSEGFITDIEKHWTSDLKIIAILFEAGCAESLACLLKNKNLRDLHGFVASKVIEHLAYTQGDRKYLISARVFLENEIRRQDARSVRELVRIWRFSGDSPVTSLSKEVLYNHIIEPNFSVSPKKPL